MKILILTLNAWNNSNSTGNTISNLFKGIQKENIANIYCRSEKINNNICDNYFRITEKDILFNFFNKSSCGTLLTNKHFKESNLDTNILGKNKTGNFLRKHRLSLLLFLRELIWATNIWKNKKLKTFISDFNPDIIYMHGHCNLYMHNILEYCRQISGAKTVIYWGDDMYGRKTHMPLGFLYETLLRHKFYQTIKKASLLLGGSLKLCKEYSAIFNKEFIPFFKECTTMNKTVKTHFNKPIIIVYAGNLLFGRDKILKKIAIAINNINKNNNKQIYQLNIYSNTIPTKGLMKILNNRPSSFFWGCKEYNYVCEEMNKADFSLFAESFDYENIQQTRLSFSTKIIDCMQANSAILAIGPITIASMEYISENKIGAVITDINTIEEQLLTISHNFDYIRQLNDNKIKFAYSNHYRTSEKILNKIESII